jgi:two-component system, chemotaxis family, sensor kinase CheA
MRDPELIRLLIGELRSHLPSLAEGAPPDSTRRALHGLKGSAGLAGETELQNEFHRLEQRVRSGERIANAAYRVAEAAIASLERGDTSIPDPWPQAPQDLVMTQLRSDLRSQYMIEVLERIEQIDILLAKEGESLERLSDAFRHVHTIKGAAGAIGDEPSEWFYHGLEQRLRGVQTEDRAEQALDTLRQVRPYLSGLIEAPAQTLARLRNVPARQSSEPPAKVRDLSIRVRSDAIDELMERMGVFGRLGESLGVARNTSQRAARLSRRARADLSEALRLIGPPKPWGAPAAALRKVTAATTVLTRLSDELERLGRSASADRNALGETSAFITKGLSSLRQTPIRELFERVSAGLLSEAKRSGVSVEIRLHGADELVDKKVLERLFDPCVQLARNSLAHGSESADQRHAKGKAPGLGVTLSATRLGQRMVIEVNDDGAGVDEAILRKKAIEFGHLPKAAERMDSDALLSLLFIPGFSTKEQPSRLAGHGVGLDVVLATVQRLGGNLRVQSEPGAGFRVRIIVPIEPIGVSRVLWVEASGVQYALMAYDVLAAIEPSVSARETPEVEAPEASFAPHLLELLDATRRAPARLAVRLQSTFEVELPRPMTIGVDGIGTLEDVVVRPLPPLVASLGPFAGCVAQGGEGLRFVLDAYQLSLRARSIRALAVPSVFPAAPQIEPT